MARAGKNGMNGKDGLGDKADSAPAVDGKYGAASPRSLKQRLESLADSGVQDLPRARTVARGRAPSALPQGRAVGQPGAALRPDATQPEPSGAQPPLGPQASPGDRMALLDILRHEVAACRRCEDLASARTNTVFGSGNPNARLCFLGEAPGADEDASGEPFVGRAGQLLTKIIEACTLTRDQVYILNVLKCRPPDNRRPEPAEVINCRGFFERQLAAIQPEFICCLGASAAQSLLETDETIGKLRGRWFTHGTAAVICTYHPSYLLRNPSAKKDVWDDMKVLMSCMGVTLS